MIVLVSVRFNSVAVVVSRHQYLALQAQSPAPDFRFADSILAAQAGSSNNTRASLYQVVLRMDLDVSLAFTSIGLKL
ncbi:MAG: hypothetical protein GKR95_16970 [Gammaproteobacteria bacterium]|nr:hypothetical protein [Gammaproteobacteria bacterium]